MSDTPITDAEEARQIAEYEKSRECGDPPFAADFEFARKMERQLAVAKVLLIHAVDSMLSNCGNSYANSYTEKWLTRAKEIGAYHGQVVGNIRDVQRDWWTYSEADNQRFPELPDGPK